MLIVGYVLLFCWIYSSRLRWVSEFDLSWRGKEDRRIQTIIFCSCSLPSNSPAWFLPRNTSRMTSAAVAWLWQCNVHVKMGKGQFTFYDVH